MGLLSPLLSGSEGSGGPIGTVTGDDLFYAPQGDAFTSSLSANQLALAALDITTAASILSLTAEVSAAGTAGAVVRLAVYADNGTRGWPGALVLDAGTIDGTSATVQTITLGSPLALAPGRYWVGAVGQGGPTTQPTMRCLRYGVSQPATAVGAGTIAWAVAQSGVTGALPANYTTTKGHTFTAPRVWMRVD